MMAAMLSPDANGALLVLLNALVVRNAPGLVIYRRGTRRDRRVSKRALAC